MFSDKYVSFHFSWLRRKKKGSEILCKQVVLNNNANSIEFGNKYQRKRRTTKEIEVQEGWGETFWENNFNETIIEMFACYFFVAPGTICFTVCCAVLWNVFLSLRSVSFSRFFSYLAPQCHEYWIYLLKIIFFWTKDFY